MRVRDIKIKSVHKRLLVLSALFVIVCSCLGSFIGINVTSSVPFLAYYHTSLDGHEIQSGDYILFEIPENQLYETGQKAVKKVSCINGQYLKTVSSERKVEYYCDGNLITTTTIFTRPNYEPLIVFGYDGIIPDGSYFVTGEHYRSYDSRYWGFVSSDSIKRLVHPLVANGLFVSSAYAGSFYSERDKGWYKYEVTPKKEDEKQRKDDKTESAAVMPKPVIPWERVATMPVKAFSKLFDEVQDYAMTYRTLDNFNDYARLRRVMFERSIEFMNVSALWGQLNPEDSSEGWFPASGFGQEAYFMQVSEIRLKYIRENRENFGLLYFFKQDCAFCEKQTPLIRYIEDESGWAIKAVDAGEYPEALLRFNIKSVPALVLVERAAGRWAPISAGLLTADQILERLYRTIKYLKGETDETDFSDPIRPDNFVESGKRRMD